MDIQERLSDFDDLDWGWNGYGAPPIPEQILERARSLSNYLQKRDVEVFPTGRGTVQFEFSLGDGKEVQVEVMSRNEVEVLIEGEDEPSIEHEFKELSVSEFKDWLENV